MGHVCLFDFGPELESGLPGISFQGASLDQLTVATLVPESSYTLTYGLLAHLIFSLQRYERWLIFRT